MVQESKLKPRGFQEFAAQLDASKDDRSFTPRQRVLNALASLLGEAELRKNNAASHSTPNVRIPGTMPEPDEKLLPYIRDPIGTALRLGIRRLGEIASGFMTIGEVVELANEAAAEFGDPGVRGGVIDKQWDGLRDRNGDCWIA